MRVSVIIPYRQNHPSRAESVKLVEQFYRETLPQAEIILADDSDPAAFNKGRAINRGVVHATGDILVFGDCDSIVPEENLQEAIKTCHQFGMVVPFTAIHYLTREVSKRWYAGDRRSRQTESVFLKPSVGVCNVIHRDYFSTVNGFDPEFHGWGYEDAALSMAIETLVGPVKWLMGDALHFWHPIDRNSSSPLQQKGLRRCQEYEAARGKEEAMLALIRSHPQHCIRAGYRHRNEDYWQAEGPNQDQLQKGIYRRAAKFFKQMRLQSVVDIACGSAYKLRVNFKNTTFRGMDSAAKVESLRKIYPEQRWDVCTTQTLADIQEDMVICVNLLEKIQHPDQLMALLSVSKAQYFVFATPDRDIVRSVSDMGPPRNNAHRREWNGPEWRQFLGQWFDVLEHDLTDDAEGVQMAVCGRKQS